MLTDFARDHAFTIAWFGLMAWWVALVVAVHFAAPVFLLDDPSMGLLALIQTVGLVVLVGRLRRVEYATSRLVGPWMGATLLVFGAVSAAIFFLRVGAPL